MTNNFDVKEAVDEFKKSIKCPDPQNCDIKLSEKIYFNFPNTNNTIIHSTNKHTHTTLYKKEISSPIGNIK